MAKKYDPIPIPMSQRMREFRVRGIPVLIFLIVAGIVALLWQDQIHSPGFMGKVVADSAHVQSPADGIVDQLFISPFDEVKRGDPVARIIRADSAYVRARLDLVRYRVEQVEAGFEPIQNLQRNIIDFENLKLDKVENRIELASLNIRKNRLSMDYQRARELFERGSISEEEFQRVETEFLLVESEVEQTEELIQQLELSIANLEPFMKGDDLRSPLLLAIRAQEQELTVIEEELKPVTVYAPIDGVINRIYKHNNQFVSSGEIMFGIESKDPAYITGFVRQPLRVIPEPGMVVQIRTRKPGREMFNSHILRVGGQIKQIEPNLQRPGSFEETGLPVQIAIVRTDDVELVPGEIVDLVMNPRN